MGGAGRVFGDHRHGGTQRGRMGMEAGSLVWDGHAGKRGGAGWTRDRAGGNQEVGAGLGRLKTPVPSGSYSGRRELDRRLLAGPGGEEVLARDAGRARSRPVA